MKFATKAIHAGMEPDPTTGAIMTPIYQTSTYVQAAPGDHKGYEYARSKNPTRTVLQNNIAALENAKYGICFSSGMGAIDTVIKLLQPGDEVISTGDLYGGSYRLFTKIFAPLGIKFKFVDMVNLTEVENAISVNTKLIWAETPTNPMMRIIDIAALSAISKKHTILLAVDNTFASPYLQNPMDLGADIVMHSATKYINGHSDVVMGILVCNDDELHNKLSFIQNSCGAVPGPQDCFLTIRGIKTLAVRMKQHCANGAAIAHFLKNHPKVEKVYWPGFADHVNHEIAKKQMHDFGGMMSFTLKNDSVEAAIKVMTNTHLFSLAESLGGVESWFWHPEKN
jgi:cystathionine gamma-lyase